MGFYFRKSIRCGPVRFNLSRSGVGVSTGVKGFRVGIGPRGTYIHAGAGGFYYRKSFSGSPSQIQNDGSRDGRHPGRPYTPFEPELTEIASESASRMTDSSAEALLTEIQERQQKWRWFPPALAAALLVPAILIGMEHSSLIASITLVCGGFGSILAYERDQLAKTVVLFYDFEPSVEKAYDALLGKLNLLAGCQRVWHVDAKGDISNSKYHAGATQVVRRNSTKIAHREPPFVKTNVPIVCLPAGSVNLYFFPDRVLVFDRTGVGAISYRDLIVETEHRQFVEEEAVPADAQVVSQTWRYTNKSGGPDKRFSNNYQIPVCLYEQLLLRSHSGLYVILQLSRRNACDGLERVLRQVAKASSGSGSIRDCDDEIQITQEFGPATQAIAVIATNVVTFVRRSLAGLDNLLRRVAGGDGFMYRFFQIIIAIVVIGALGGLVVLFRS